MSKLQSLRSLWETTNPMLHFCIGRTQNVCYHKATIIRRGSFQPASHVMANVCSYSVSTHHAIKICFRYLESRFKFCISVSMWISTNFCSNMHIRFAVILWLNGSSDHSFISGLGHESAVKRDTKSLIDITLLGAKQSVSFYDIVLSNCCLR